MSSAPATSTTPTTTTTAGATVKPHERTLSQERSAVVPSVHQPADYSDYYYSDYYYCYYSDYYYSDYCYYALTADWPTFHMTD